MNRIYKVIDLEGEWILNPHGFSFTDPTTGVRFDSGFVYRVALNDWILGQMAAGVLVSTEDAEKAEAAQLAAEAEAQKAEAAARAEAEKLALAAAEAETAAAAKAAAKAKK